MSNDSCVTLVQSDVTSGFTSGRGGRDSRSSRKCLLPWMYEGSVSIKGWMNCVT